MRVQVRSYQRDIGILSKQLSDIKSKYFQQKRAEKAERDSATPQPLYSLDPMAEESQLAIKAVRITAT